MRLSSSNPPDDISIALTDVYTVGAAVSDRNRRLDNRAAAAYHNSHDMVHVDGYLTADIGGRRIDEGQLILRWLVFLPLHCYR